MKFPKILNFVIVSLAALSASYFTYTKLHGLDKVKTHRADKQSMKLAKASLNDSIVDFSMQLLGTPYVAGGNGKNGFDCSGFVHYVFKHFKITVPRSSADFEFFGEEVPIDEVEKGDLLLFSSPTRKAIGHIGIVSEAKGSESMFIHATSGRQMSVVVSSMAGNGYKNRFIKAIRVL